MNRRTFLRVLGSAAVVTAVPQSVVHIAEALAPKSFFGPVWDSRTAPPLTYEMLEQAYRSACIGQEVPNIMIVSRSVARQFGLIYDVDVDDVAA